MPTASVRTPPNHSSVPPDHAQLQIYLDHLESTLKELHDQLRAAQKLASVGTMAAMLAHEYNNLATPALCYAQHAVDKNDPELMRQALDMVSRRLRAIGSLSQRVLDFAADRSSALEPVHLRAVVDDALTTLGRDLAKDRITVRILIDAALTARANYNQLEQVLFNLIVNARQAMLPGRGTLTIDAEPTGDRQVTLCVRDTGPGISAENLPHVFTPFFTTKKDADQPDKRGIGLGLPVCRNIIESFHGTITADAVEGEGTTITITLNITEN